MINLTATQSTSSKRALITGVTGQDGSYLAELLLSKGYEVWGMVRAESQTTRISHLLKQTGPNRTLLRLILGDLCNTHSLASVLETTRPDELYHLGAQSHVQKSIHAPEHTGNVTGLGTVRLLEAIRTLRLPTRFVEASSAEIFGKTTQGRQTEQSPIHPYNPYGIAKAYAYFAVMNYREAYDMFAASGILYNHESPRRGEAFVTRKVTRAIGRILTNQQEYLSLGNLDVCRDWGFAGDYVEALWRMLQTEKAENYIIATGKTHSLREFCELAFAHAGLPITWSGSGINEVAVDPQGRVVIKIDSQHFRPFERNAACGDPAKANTDLSWTPQVGFKELVQMMTHHDMELAQAELKIKE
ncbi:GDP-mannose 4,6-dehydratase [Planctomicrobium sp. SH668]|uniref:GDP-mannose 4,6-dehydratase n=1 Tax=Planctomicrobium sp. SH668 TaxID=3448126 RepID=UPI003F5B5EAC